MTALRVMFVCSLAHVAPARATTFWDEQDASITPVRDRDEL